MARIISIFSAKGGVGKTAISSNLSFALASKFRRNVALVDCNISTPHLALCLGIYHPKLTLNDYLRGEITLDQAVTTSTINYTIPEGMKFVPAAIELNDVIKTSPEQFKAALNDVFHDSEIVFLDAAPGLGREALLSLKVSDEVLFVATPHIPSVIDVTKSLRLVQRVGAKPLGVVLNRVRSRKYEIGRQEAEQILDLPILGVIPEDESVLKSMNSKIPVVMSDGNLPVSQAFFELAAKLVGFQYYVKSENVFGRLRRLIGIGR